MKSKLINRSIVFGILLALVFSLCLVFTNNHSVAFAASSSESESNDTSATANQISTNSSVSGNLSVTGDVDWYKFTISQNGYFNVSFEHVFLSSSSAYWRIYIYDSSAVNNIDGGTDTYFTSAGNANATTNTYGVSAGTYYIRIARGSSSYYSANQYTLTVNYTVANDWETENNNTSATANDLYVNQTIHGTLSRSGEVDWYKFEVPQNGYFNISFEHEFLSFSSGYWRVYIYDNSAVNNIDGGMDTYFTSAGNANCTTNTFGVPAGTYYIQIARGSSSYHSANPYSVTVNYSASNEWELENNNTKESANSISLSQTINGSLTRSGDVDWYVFSVSSSREIAVTFNHVLMTSSSSYWKIHLYDSTGVTELLTWGRRGDTESATSDYVNISSGTYYIKVERYSSSYYSANNYSLCLVERHDHTGVWQTTIESTCTQKGTSSRTCTICGLVETQEIDALGHDYDDGVYTKETTITQRGEIQYTCQRCGDQFTERDNSKVWILPVIIVVGLIVLIGVINYIRVIRKKKP